MRALRREVRCGPAGDPYQLPCQCLQPDDGYPREERGCFRGEIERALMLGAEYLVLHPGSWKGLTRNEGLKLAAESIARAMDGLPWQGTDFQHSDREHGRCGVLAGRQL